MDDEERRQRRAALGEVAGTLAHEINNALTSVVGYAGLLRRHLPEGDPARGDVDEVLAAAERGTDLLRQMLSFERQLEAHREPTELTALFALLDKPLRKLLGPERPLRVEVAPGLAPVLVDRALLGHALLAMVMEVRDRVPPGPFRIVVADEAAGPLIVVPDAPLGGPVLAEVVAAAVDAGALLESPLGLRLQRVPAGGGP